MSGGRSYTDCATHDEFCDTTVGSGREDEEEGSEGKYDEVNRVLRRDGAGSWPVRFPRRVVSSKYTLFACSSPFFFFHRKSISTADSAEAFGK